MEMRFDTMGPRVQVGLEVHEDLNRKTLHVFDLDIGTTLTNVMDAAFQARVLARLGYADDIEDWTWLLYHTDGVATEYRHGFRAIAKDDKRLYAPFLEALKQRT